MSTRTEAPGTAPRVVLNQVENEIASEHYFTAAQGFRAAATDNNELTDEAPAALGMITICVLILRNGHRIVGVNEGPVSAPNFDADLGRKLAREKAVAQVWPLLGFRLRDKLAGA